MKRTVIAISISMLFSGCASVQSTSDDLAKKMGMSKAGGGAVVGATVGCAGGAFLGYVTGAGVGEGCAAGAVVGGLIGYADGRQRDLDDAKKLVEEIRSIAPPVQHVSSEDASRYEPKVQSQQISVKRKDRKPEQVTAFKSLSVPVPAGSIHDRSPSAQKTLGKIGGFAASRSTDTVIYVAVDEKDRKFVAESLNQGISNSKPSDGRAMKVGTHRSPTTKIKFVSLKKGDIPSVTVSPVGVEV